RSRHGSLALVNILPCYAISFPINVKHPLCFPGFLIQERAGQPDGLLKCPRRYLPNLPAQSAPTSPVSSIPKNVVPIRSRARPTLFRTSRPQDEWMVGSYASRKRAGMGDASAWQGRSTARR
ncbi:uncharacterized protein K441DRAFT_231871, partial [Cenococcum geophilum 1.58]|uniref:uncharacterized protein n=1 Tax=Cenococcum geophilum 1.58 TaxID=794803 RepID=UPI00358EC04D